VEQLEHALMLAFNVALLHVGILIMFSKHVTAYLKQDELKPQ
jgi:nitrate reductase gamma subunit